MAMEAILDLSISQLKINLLFKHQDLLLTVCCFNPSVVVVVQLVQL